ncbi:MAG: glycosyltransferase [Flavobacteriaceae bacterium]
MSKKKVLFVCGNIGANSSQGVRYRNILPFLANEYNLFMLSYNDFFNGSNVNKIVLNNNSQNIQKVDTSIYSKIKIEFVKIYKKTIRPFVFPDKYKYYINKYKLEVKQLLNSNDISTVVIGMTPFSLFELPQYIKSINSEIQVIVDLSDPFSLNGANNYAFIYNDKYLKNYEKERLKHVDDLIVLNPTIKKMYKETFNYKRVHVIEQGVNIEKNDINKSDYNLKQDYSMIYAGGLYHGFREAFELYKAIDNVEKQVSLKMFGNINNYLLAKNNSNIEFFGQIDHEKLNQEYRDSDILIFIDNKEGYQVPGKILELMAMQKPILFIYSNNNSPTLFYINDSDFIVKVKNNAKAIIAGINQIQKRDFRNSNRIDIDQFSWKNLIKEYKKLIND